MTQESPATEVDMENLKSKVCAPAVTVVDAAVALSIAKSVADAVLPIIDPAVQIAVPLDPVKLNSTWN